MQSSMNQLRCRAAFITTAVLMSTHCGGGLQANCAANNTCPPVDGGGSSPSVDAGDAASGSPSDGSGAGFADVGVPSNDSGSSPDGMVAGRDGGSPDATAARDAEQTVDATAADGAIEDGSLGDADEGDAAEASVPIACNEVTSCTTATVLASNEPNGSWCYRPTAPAGSVSGDTSGWWRLDLDYACANPGYVVYLISSPSALFDMEIYSADATYADAGCPTLTGFYPAEPLGGGLNPAAEAQLPDATTEHFFIHVIAEQDASCSTGAAWTLEFGTLQ